MRRQYRMRAGLAIAAIFAAQLLLVAHDFEHPVQHAQPCTICLFCDSAGQALTATAVIMPAALQPPQYERPALTGYTVSTATSRSIRAPPQVTFLV